MVPTSAIPIQNDTYAHLQWTLVTGPSNGTAVVNPDGSCTITRNSLTVKQLVFVYRISDDGADNNFATTGDNLTDEATVTVNFAVNTLTPILLSNFTVTRNDAAVTVKWTTTTESNNKQFEIQRSIAGAAYQTIANIASKARDGNSAVPLQYEFRESNATKGITAYRLVQVDKDNTKTIYGAKMVRGMNNLAKILLYPNPSKNGNLTIIFDDAQAKDIVINDLSGKVVQKWTNYAQSNLAVTGLRAGLYMVMVTGKTSSEKQVQKLVVTQ